MPLVHVGRLDEEPITEAQERARKVKPQYTGGDLIKVAGGRNQAEAELIQGMLLEEGIPSVQRRTRGFDVPDFLAAGPRDILVPQAAAEDARALLAQAESRVPGANGSAAPRSGDRFGTAPDSGERPLRLLVWILVAFVAAAAIVWVLYQLTT